MEMNINIQQTLFFLKKTKRIKQKKPLTLVILIIALIKMRLLIFLVFMDWLKIIFEISIYNWMHIKFSDIFGIAFSYF